MANPQLLEYIARELERGVTAESLREALLQAGWRSADIDDAFRALENGDTTPEASQKSTADLSTQTSLETVLARDQVRTNETNEKESVASPVNVDEQAKLQLPATGALSEQAKETRTVQEIIKPTPSEQTTPLLAMPNTIGSITASAPSRIKRVFLAIGVFLVLGGGAGGVYYYVNYVNQFSRNNVQDAVRGSQEPDINDTDTIMENNVANPATSTTQTEPIISAKACGDILDTHLFLNPEARTKLEKSTLDCFASSLIECAPSTLSVTGNDKGGFTVIRKSGTGCVVSSKTKVGEKSCNIPISVIIDLQNYAQQNKEPLENIIIPISFLMAFEEATNIETKEPIAIICSQK